MPFERSKRRLLGCLWVLAASFFANACEAAQNPLPAPAAPAEAPTPVDELVPPGPESLPGGELLPPIRDEFADPLSSAQGATPGAQPINPTPFNTPPPFNSQTPLPNRGLRSGGLGLNQSLGVTAGSFSAAPTMMGDLFGGGVSIVNISRPVTTNFFSQGTVLAGSSFPDSVQDVTIAFDFGSGTPNDLFTAAGTGVDRSGDGFVDQFGLLEPIPPTDAPTSPGEGFVFNGGSATYVGKTPTTNTNAANGQFQDGDFWYISYSYALENAGNGAAGIVVAGPDVATRRSKLSENFSPELRDRVFFNYSFFNDAFGGLGDVSRYVLGFEKILLQDAFSVEVRLPMAGTYSSRQQIDRGNERDFELGNLTLIGKALLLRTPGYTVTTGLGLTLPIADDARLLLGERELLRIENQSVHLLPFLGVLHRFNDDTSFQAYSQLDFDLNGNPVLANLDGGPLRGIGRFNDATLLHLDASVHRVVFRTDDPRYSLKSVIANAELHYTGTLQDADNVSGDGVAVTDLKRNFNILNATFGAHLLVGRSLVVTPAMSVPLRDGLDKQFDYEAILQLAYMR